MMKTGWTVQSGAPGPGGQVGWRRRPTLPGGSQKEGRAGGYCPASLRTSRWAQPAGPPFWFYHHLVQLLAIAVLRRRTLAMSRSPASKRGIRE